MEFIFVLIQDFSRHILLYALVFFLTISFVVFVHEMGHFLTARLFGVRVQKFSVGFGKELFGFTSKKGTRWSLSRIPLGGYVEIFGYSSAADPLIWDKELQKRRPLHEDEKPFAFCEKPLWQRMLIVAMGPFINFLFAFLIFYLMFITIGQGSTRPVITAVAVGTPGYEAGLKPRDRIVSLNGEKVIRFEDIWQHSFEPGMTLTFEIERNGQTFEKTITTIPVKYRDEKGIDREHGRIGATNYPASKLDEIISVNGVPVPQDKESLRAMLNEIMDQPARYTIPLSENRNSEYLIYPRSASNKSLNDPDDIDHDFFFLQQNKDPFFVRHGPVSAAWYAMETTYSYIDESLKFIAVLFKGRGDPEKFGGLATMGQATQRAVDKGSIVFLTFVAILSIQIGFINLLPVPALDGGYLIFFLYEAITGRALPERIQDYALITGIVLLFGFMIFVNINDILRWS